MQAFIGATLLTSKETQPQSKPFEIYDSRLPSFLLRVQPSGVRSYYARFGRNHLAPDQRREAVAKLNEKPLLALTLRLQWEGFSAANCFRINSMVATSVERKGLAACFAPGPQSQLQPFARL